MNTSGISDRCVAGAMTDTTDPTGFTTGWITLFTTGAMTG